MKKPFSLRTIILTASLLLHLGTFCCRSHAAAGDVDLSFDPGWGVNGDVRVLEVQPDGKVLISGSFTTVKGLVRIGIARLNEDGSGDSSFNPAVAGVGPFALQADGKVLVNTYDGLVRLNTDGSLDNTYSASIVAFDEWISSIAVQPDGKVLIGGTFTVVNGTNRFGIARLNANGTLDNSFDPGTGANYVIAIAVQPDGRVLIAGGFQSVNGTNRNGLARLNTNGSLDGTFDPGAGASSPGAGVSGSVASMALQPDGKVVIGGSFTAVNGTNRKGLARLNANGSLDGSFNPGTVLTDSPLTGTFYIQSLVVQTDGKLVVGGVFGVNATNSANVARFNANGTLDSGFNPDNTYTDSDVYDVFVQPDGRVLMGGAFTLVQGTIHKYIARFNVGGSLDTSFNPGSAIDNGVLTTALQPDGKLVIGGTFTTVGGLARTGLARLNPDGSTDSTFNPSIKFWASVSHIRSVALQPDGKILVTGIFVPTIGTLPHSTLSHSIARFNTDGSWDTSFQPDLWPFVQPGDCVPGFSCWQRVAATSLLLQPDGKVLISGESWTTISGDEFSYEVVRPFLARFNTNGTLDGSFTSGTNYSGNCMVLQPDGKIVVGGWEGISRLNPNGTLDPSFNATVPRRIHLIAVQPDGKVIIGGDRYMLPGTNYHVLARLNANGSLDGSFNFTPSITGGVLSIALQPDGKVLVGGGFSYVENGTNYIYGITRCDSNGSLDASFNPGTGADGLVRSIALQSDGKVLIAGDFFTVNGVVRSRIARLHGANVAPSLTIARSNAFVIVSWPFPSTGYVLQQSTNLHAGNWTTPSETITDNGTTKSINVSPATGNCFFRLFKP